MSEVPLHNRLMCSREREFFIDNLLVRFHFIIVMIGWTGLVPWVIEFPFPGSLASTFLVLFDQRGAPPAAERLQRERSLLTTYWSESTLSS